jgi:uncharacterized coiled-coil protein SlyX
MKSPRRKAVTKPAPAADAPPAPVPAAEENAPFGQAMQNLFSLAGMMRNMAPEGAAPGVNPKLVLTGNGMEIRFSGPGTETQEAAESVESPESGDRLANVERTLRTLSARIAKIEKAPGSSQEWFNKVDHGLLDLRESIAELEAQIAAQAEVIESLRSAVQQNEEMMETLVDSMNMVDDLATQPGLGPALVLSAETIAS